MPRLRSEEALLELQILAERRVFLGRQDAGQEGSVLFAVCRERQELPSLEAGQDVLEEALQVACSLAPIFKILYNTFCKSTGEYVGMTCQWCIHYRRRGGISLCLAPDGDGKVVPVGIKDLACAKFKARKSCTTCEYRCSQEEKGELMFAPGGCPKWVLRALSTWGGARRFRRCQQNEVSVTQTTQKETKKEMAL